MSSFCPGCNILSHLLSPSIFRRSKGKLLKQLPNPPRCDVCRFLSALIDRHDLPDDISGLPVFIRPLGEGINDSFLVGIQLGWNDEVPFNIFSIQRCNDYWKMPNYPLIRSWIDNCHSHHIDSCEKTPDVTVPNFTLLNVHTRQLVTRLFVTCASDAYTPYIALSYVWGKADDHTDPMDVDLPTSGFPCLIDDVLTVAKNLGYDFIWVDRYCIPSDNPIAKHDQIANMGHIYRNADLTVIASHGLDPNQGLNGISEPRTPPERVGDWVVHPAHTALRTEVLESKWNSRGWTYQEAILSRRLLVFTSTQCYFQCNVGYQLEYHPTDLNKPLDLPPIFDLVGTSAGEEQPLDHSLLEVYITEFCPRILTFEKDRFQAIKRVLYDFEGRSKSLRIFQGIPLVTGIEFSNNTASLTLGLSWYNDATVPLTRVPEFPSWTWLGWRLECRRSNLERTETAFHLNSGDLSWTDMSSKPRPLSHRSLMNIFLITGSRCGHSWETVMSENLKGFDSEQHIALHLKCWHLSLNIENIIPEVYDWREGSICFRKRGYVDIGKKGNARKMSAILVHSRVVALRSRYESLIRRLRPAGSSLSTEPEKDHEREKEYIAVIIGIMLVNRKDEIPFKCTRSGWVEAAIFKESPTNKLNFEEHSNLDRWVIRLLKEADCVKGLEWTDVILE